VEQPPLRTRDAILTGSFDDFLTARIAADDLATPAR